MAELVTLRHADGREADFDPATVDFWADLGWKPAKTTAARKEA